MNTPTTPATDQNALHQTFKQGVSGLILSVSILVALSGCGEETKAPEVPAEAQLKPAGPLNVQLTNAQVQSLLIQTGAVQTQLIKDTVVLNGQVQAANNLNTHIFSPVPGRASKINVNLGQKVSQGQTLAMILSDQVGQLEADLMQQMLQIDQDISQANVQLIFSEANYKREMKLFKDRISSKADMEAAFTQYRKDIENLKGLRTKRQATIDTYQERLTLYGVANGVAEEVVKNDKILPYISIKAPRNGILINRNINDGELADPTKELFSLADLSQVWLVGNIYEKDIQTIHVGQPVEVSLDSLPDQKFEGKVSFVGNVLDPQTRTLDLRVDIPNSKLIFKPNMFARMQIYTGSRRVLGIPNSAVQKSGDYSFVYIPIGPNQYEERQVTTGLTEKNFTEILSGLVEGEKIVTQGTESLKEFALKRSAENRMIHDEKLK
ncbi:MAG: efflux RND transporter periplasmic adaptor subunit [Cyanobacteria bacterium]|nr:efflux RND transporter periplasmic adaptor subunit [Cyanobacteriota bacterium]